MKLRVNLYVQALQPVKEKISLKLLVSSTLGLCVVLLIAGLVMNMQTQTKQAELAVLQQQVKAQEQQLTQLQATLGSRQPSPALVKQRTELNQIIAQKQKLLQFVQGEQLKTSVKYSPVFKYLASIDPQGFWLSSFSLNANSSQFSGYVTEPELLPKWLNQLGGTEFFKGHTFSQFEIKQVENTEALAFKVTSSAAGVASEEAKP
ncbi:PilN domain-containing protein [Rheinheimera faecalis]